MATFIVLVSTIPHNDRVGREIAAESPSGEQSTE